MVINFDPKLNVIIGANGCCKTTVIDAIRLFYSLGDKDRDIDIVPEDFHKEIVVKSEQAHPLGDGENHSLEAKNDRNRAEKTEHIRSKVANPS